MKKRSAPVRRVLKVVAAVLSAFFSCPATGDQVAALSPAAPVAAAAPAALPAPTGLRLRGKCAVLFDKETPQRTIMLDFEILLDNAGNYYSRASQGTRENVAKELFSETIELVLPYWRGAKSQTQSEFGGRGGGNSGYEDTRKVVLPGRRLFPLGKSPGASKDLLTFDSESLHEEFSELHDHHGILIPHQYLWREKGDASAPVSTYTITDVEVLTLPQAEAFKKLKTQLFGDIRFKDSVYPDGAKHKQYIYNGEFPALTLEYAKDGALLSAITYADGLQTQRMEWYPGGNKKSLSQTRPDASTYTWTSWTADGKKNTEGQQTFHDDGTLSGWLATYHPSGKPKTIQHESHNLIDGVYQSWDESGQLLDDAVYRNGEPWSGTFYSIHSGVHGAAGLNSRTPVYYRDGKLIPAPQ